MKYGRSDTVISITHLLKYSMVEVISIRFGKHGLVEVIYLLYLLTMIDRV